MRYKQIEFVIGSSIKEAVDLLLTYKRQGELVCGDFNGTMLYSDKVTVDNAYKQITGKTKAEFDKSQKEWRYQLEKREQEHKRQIPALSKKWMEEGRRVLSEDKWELWDKMVPVRLNDLYRGMELECCLDIVEVLNSNGTFDEAKQIIEDQGHSGMSHGLVCAMIKEVCDRGEEFVKYISKRIDE